MITAENVGNTIPLSLPKSRGSGNVPDGIFSNYDAKLKLDLNYHFMQLFLYQRQ
jgi:hypothetical protein